MIGEQDHGKLLRSYLREQGVSSALSARLKRTEDGMMLNGIRVTVRAVLTAGDVLDLAIEERESPPHVVPRDIPVEALLETEDLLVVNKPADMPTHPSHGHFEDTLANGLAYRYAVNGVSFRPHFINRLDRNTTGTVLVARHALAASFLSDRMARGEIKKTYLALVRGRVDAPFIIESGIRRRAESIIFREVCPVGEGDYAKTEVEPLVWGEDFSLVRLIPYTGRTHQLRVHMASVGHSLLGDDLYGVVAGDMKRHALHAASLTFPAPRTEKMTTVRAPLPADMMEQMSKLGREAVMLAKKECGQTGQKL
ncbi:MAG: RluA family pseudouridine synthase [Clostridia bacterium]|nr:RluA family pseudouridine synthase [Clostridia bacterium]